MEGPPIGSGFPSLPKFASNRSTGQDVSSLELNQLIDEVCLNTDGPAQKMGNEHLGERRFLVDHADDRRFFQPHDETFRHGRRRRYPLRLPGETAFT
jgi:hypothetical protein